jgi:hypothetical protein
LTSQEPREAEIKTDLEEEMATELEANEKVPKEEAMVETIGPLGG